MGALVQNKAAGKVWRVAFEPPAVNRNGVGPPVPGPTAPRFTLHEAQLRPSCRQPRQLLQFLQEGRARDGCSMASEWRTVNTRTPRMTHVRPELDPPSVK